MSRPSLRIATDSSTSLEMPEAIESLARQCIAARPVAVLMMWEVVEDGKHNVHVRSIPDSAAMRKGLSAELYDLFWPQVGEAE